MIGMLKSDDATSLRSIIVFLLFQNDLVVLCVTQSLFQMKMLQFQGSMF